MTNCLYVYLKFNVRDKKRTDEKILKERPDYADVYPSFPDVSKLKTQYFPPNYRESLRKMSKDPARTFMRNEKKGGGKQSKKSKEDTEGEFIEELELHLNIHLNLN